MHKFAFISRHQPTPEQVEMAKVEGIELIPIGDRDAFDHFAFSELGVYAGVVVVHPWMALRASHLGFAVGIFENSNRAPEGEKPQFTAKKLWVDWDGFTR